MKTNLIIPEPLMRRLEQEAARRQRTARRSTRQWSAADVVVDTNVLVHQANADVIDPLE